MEISLEMFDPLERWTNKAWAQGIRPLDCKDFKKVILCGPLPNIAKIKAES